MDSEHGFNDWLRATSVTDSKSRHREGFGKSVKEDSTVFHPWNRGDGNVFSLEG